MPRKPHKKPEDREQKSTRPFWSGTITFGLVSVPVDLHPATRSSHVGLRMLGPGGRLLQRKYFSTKSDRELDDKDLVSGYEIKKGKYVVVTDEELERLEPKKSRDIDLKRFVEASKIPPLYFEHPYFLAPASESVKAYRLLATVMENTGQAGIATFVMHGKECLIAILAANGILRAETLRFSDEIVKPVEAGLPKKTSVSIATVRKFANTIRRQTRKSLTRALRDEHSEHLRKYAEKKKRGRTKDVVDVEAFKTHDAAAVDIMSVLKKSLGQPHRRAA
jgi:DNA end-binding protein Ku